LTWPRGIREAGLALIVAATALLGLNSRDSALLRGMETASLDLRFRLRGARPPGPEVAVVLVDDRSLAALGRWPLSRRLFGKAVDTLDRAGAKVIVFDLLFAEPEEPVSSEVRSTARAAAGALSGPETEALRKALEQIASDQPDVDLARRIKTSGKVLVPIAFAFQGPAEEGPSILSESAYQQLDPSPIEPSFPLQPVSVVSPVPVIAEAATGLGHVNIAYDRDGAPRYDYLAVPFSGDFLPSLPVRVAANYLGLPWPEVGLVLGQGIRLGTTLIPTDPGMRLLVNYRGPRGTVPTYSLIDLLADRLEKDAFTGRIVVLGASFLGISDTNVAPFDNTPMPGSERMAHIIDSLIQHDFIRENPAPWPLATIGLVALLAIAGGFGTAVVPTRLVALPAAAPVLAWGAGAQAAFVEGLWLSFVNPAISLIAATLTVLLFRYGLVDVQRRRVQAAFRHYLAPDLVDELAQHPERLQLGGETRALTVMFSDIRGFTSISETFKSNPQGLSRLINRGFLSPMTALIMARRGTIDKYMGDCIMAFWNAPLDDPGHADHACESALAMVCELDRINVELEREAESDGRVFHPIHIGIGLNTGECVVGNMGSDERFAYTAMGDAVNLASRLEGQSKNYHVTIVLGEETRAAAPSWAALELDLIAVKGKQDAVRIYTLLGDAERAQSPEFRSHAERHDRMLAAYRAQDWTAAHAALCECRCRGAELAGFYDLYEERIAEYAANPPGADWDGVFVAETK